MTTRVKPVSSEPLQSLIEIRQFIQVAQSQSFSKAAQALNQTTAAVSAGIKRLEASMGVRLFERSTRSVRLTAEGKIFFQGCKRALAELDTAVELSYGATEIPQGQVTLSAPTDLAKTLLNQYLNEFQHDYPDIALSVRLGDSLADLKKSAIDLAIRFGVPADSSLIARPLINRRRLACASPAYLAQHGTPEHPYELEQHSCICYYVKDQLDRQWRFFDQQETLTVNVQGRFSTDDSSLARQWAVEGKGIVYKSELDMLDDIENGRLLPVLTKYQGQESPLYIVYPSRENLPKRTQVLMEYLLKQFQQLDHER